MKSSISKRPPIETQEERDLRFKSYALLNELNPLLGRFYAKPDLVSDAIVHNISQANVSRLNAAYNKMREGGELDEKEQKIVLGVVKSALLLNFKPLRTFLGDEKYGAFVVLLVQKFMDQYKSVQFEVPEELKETLGDVDDDTKDEKGKSGDDADSSESDGEDGGDSGAESDGDADGSEDSEGDDADSEEGSGDDAASDEEGGEDEGGEDEDAALESESADKKPKNLYNIDAPTMIVLDLIKYMKSINWEDISKRLVQIKEADGFESKSSEVIATRRITFRKSRKQQRLPNHMVNMYEIVLNGEPVGLIHSFRDEDNAFNKRIWRVALRNHFRDEEFRSGFSAEEPFTLVRSGRIVLHNPIPSTMREARAWVRTVLEK